MTDLHSDFGTSVKDSCVPAIQTVPSERVRTSYAWLRPGRPAGARGELVDLPLRVVMADDGGLEVVDGFKRLKRWREAGATHLSVVVEHDGHTAIENKRLLLLANAPRRTITPWDEALVVRSLVEDDHLSQRAVAKLLGRKVGWVARRLALAKNLSAAAAERVSKGELGVSVAHVLTTLPPDHQTTLLQAIDKHGLRTREAILLVQTYRIATDSERRQILKDPIARVRPRPTPIVSPRAADIETRLEMFRKTLEELRAFTLPADLAPAEERRLSAQYRAVCAELVQTVQELGLDQNQEALDEGTEDCLQPSLESSSTDGHGTVAPDSSLARPVQVGCKDHCRHLAAAEKASRPLPCQVSSAARASAEIPPCGPG